MRSLLDAVRHGSLSDVIDSLNEGANVEEKDSDGYRPLMAAAIRGMKGMVDLLIENGARINVSNRNHATAFFFAVKKDFKQIAFRLAAEGAAVDTRTGNGVRALHWAAYNNSPDLIRLILENGGRPSINERDDQGNRALHYAAQSNGIAAIQLLQGHGASKIAKNNKNRTAYDEANMRGYTNAAALLA